MKNSLMSLILFSLLGVTVLRADQGSSDTFDVSTAGSQAKSRGTPARASTLDQGLVDLSKDMNKAKIDDLERRVRELERDNRAVNEKIRSLDYAVDDIKRRRLR